MYVFGLSVEKGQFHVALSFLIEFPTFFAIIILYVTNENYNAGKPLTGFNCYNTTVAFAFNDLWSIF